MTLYMHSTIVFSEKTCIGGMFSFLQRTRRKSPRSVGKIKNWAPSKRSKIVFRVKMWYTFKYNGVCIFHDVVWLLLSIGFSYSYAVQQRMFLLTLVTRICNHVHTSRIIYHEPTHPADDCTALSYIDTTRGGEK